MSDSALATTARKTARTTYQPIRMDVDSGSSSDHKRLEISEITILEGRFAYPMNYLIRPAEKAPANYYPLSLRLTSDYLYRTKQNLGHYLRYTSLDD